MTSGRKASMSRREIELGQCSRLGAHKPVVSTVGALHCNSQPRSSACVVDAQGEDREEAKVASELEALVVFLRNPS